MIEIFGPGWGNYAIRGILETSMPEAISLRPETPGWWILLGILMGSGLYVAWKRRQHYLHNRYRREAQAALDTLQANYGEGDRDCLRELAPLLRATAIEAVGRRQELVGLSGVAWQNALQKMAPTLPPLPISQLEALAYQPLSEVDSEIDSLFTALRDWVMLHEHPHA